MVSKSSFQPAIDALAPFMVDEAAAIALLAGKGRHKGSRWAGTVECRLPSPPEWRGRTWDDETSFHFNWNSISKATWPTLKGALLQRKHGRSGRAMAFEAYLGRPGVAELVTLDHYEDYLLRDAAFDWEEVEDEDGGPDDLAITNIPGGRAGRERFWRAVERHERAPTVLRLHFHPEDDPDYDTKVDEDVPAGSPIAAHVKKEWAAWRDHRRHSNARFLGEWLEVSPDEAGPLLHAIATRRQLGQADLLYPTIENATAKKIPTPVTFESRGGGRIQYRGEMELPHDLPPRQRRRIALMFGMLLARWGFRFTMVIHTPDPHGNPKNKHLHVIFYDRPCEFLAEHGKWDFEVEAKSTNPKNRGRVSYPYRQEKVKAVSQSRGRSGFVESGKEFFKYLRAEFAKIVNVVLETCGEAIRFDPRPYRKLGIDVAPMTHWGKGNSALEKVGIPTRKIVLEAIRRWEDLEALARAELDEQKANNHEDHAEVLEWLADQGRGQPESLRMAIREAAERRHTLSDEFAQIEFERSIFRLRLERAQSRANVILRAKDWATANDLAEASEKIKAGEKHILDVEQATDPFQARFFEIWDEQEAYRRAIRSLDELIQLCRDDPAALYGVGLDARSDGPLTYEDAPWPDGSATTPPPAGTSAAPPPPTPAPTPLKRETGPPPPPPPSPVPPPQPSASVMRESAAEAERQAQRLAAEDRERRTAVYAALEWARKQPVTVDRNGNSYFCWPFQQDNPPGIAALLKRPELSAIAQQGLKAIYQLQLELADALKKSARIVFETDGRIAKESVPEALQAALEARAHLPTWCEIAAQRALTLDQAAAARLVAEVEQKHIRARVADDGAPMLDAAPLSAESHAFLSAPRNRLMIGAALKPLIERQSSTIERICDFISKHESSVDFDGKLNVDLLPNDLQAAASAWVGEAEVAAATQRWTEELEKIVAKLHASEAPRAARREAEAAARQSDAASSPVPSDSGERQAAPANESAGGPPAEKAATTIEAERPGAMDPGPSAEDWERLASEVLRRELALKDKGKSFWIEGLNDREKAILFHESFGDEFSRRLSAAAEEIDRTFRIVLGDLEVGRIRFTPDGPDMSKLTPEEVGLIDLHRHRVRIEDVLVAVRERREAEEKEYQELLARDAQFRAGKGPGK